MFPDKKEPYMLHGINGRRMNVLPIEAPELAKKVLQRILWNKYSQLEMTQNWLKGQKYLV